jgi:hypothetical protein
VRRGDLGAHFAAVPGGHRAKSPDHGRKCEEPAVPGNKAKEVGAEAGDAEPAADRADSALLLFRREHRALHEPPQIVAGVDGRGKALQLAFDTVDGGIVAGKIEKGGGVTLGNA